MSDKYYWVFKEESGLRQGLAATKMENRGGKFGRIQTFVREICQNSKDAKNSSTPVEIVFDRFTMNVEDFPDFKEYRNVIDKCISTEENEGGTPINITRLKGYRNEMRGDKGLTVLRISDFNTTGLRDSKTEKIMGEWALATMSTGMTNKGAGQGGSFGRGKASYFEVSRVRSLFFSTRDDEGNEASQGIGMLTPFVDDDVIRSNLGRCGDKHGKPIFKQLSLNGSRFNRLDSNGTDIYIMGYEDKSDAWEEPIIVAVMHDFFFSIINDGLVVTVGDVRIDSKTIYAILQQTIKKSEKDFNFDMQHLHACIMTMKSPVKNYPENNPRYKLYIRPSENELNGIMSIRSGMTISNAYYTPRRMNLVGIVAIVDSEVSSLLKNAENVTHNKWNADDLPEESREKCKTYINEIYEFVRGESDKLYSRDDEHSIEAAGVDRYLYKEEFTEDNVKRTVKDSQFASINEVRVTTHVSKIKHNSEGEKELLPARNPENDEFVDTTGALSQKDRLIKSDVSKRAIPDDDPNENKQPFERIFKTRRIIKNVRVCIDTSKKHNIWFDINQTGAVYLRAKLILENGDVGEALNIIDATSNGEIVDCKGTLIGPVPVTENVRNNILLSVAYPTLCSLRLEVVEDEQ